MLQKVLLEIPSDFMCPITHCIMREPVKAADGGIYEREAIEALFAIDADSPKTGAHFLNKILRKCWKLSGCIEQYVQGNPWLQQSTMLYLPQAWIKELARFIRAKRLVNVIILILKEPRLLTTPLEGDYKAFHMAAAFGSVAITQELWRRLQSCAKTETVFPLPQPFKAGCLNLLLEEALQQVDTSQAEQWWKLGADVEQPDSMGNSLLARSVVFGDGVKVTWLLAHGASLSASNQYGDTPLHLSFIHHQSAIITLLFNHQADPMIRNKAGKNVNE